MKIALSTNLIACAAIAGAIATGFASGAASAQSRPGPEPFAFQFAFDRAEMTNIAAAENLLERLHTAVRRHCVGDRQIAPSERRIVDTCIDKTMEAAVTQFGNPTLAEAYKSRADG